MPIALYTFGITKFDRCSRHLASFGALLPGIYQNAHRTPGFLAQAMDERPDLTTKDKVGEDYGPWGDYVLPRFQLEGTTPDLRAITTLSLWTDRDSARHFVYEGFHRKALDRRYEWFEKGPWPGYVMWTLKEGRFPTWGDGARRLEELHDEGQSADRFVFGKLDEDA